MLTEDKHPGSCIVSEAADFHCRDAATISLSQTIKPNMVLGAVAVIAGVTSSAAADGGNTGNGTLTLDVTAPVAAKAKNGVYRAVCIEPAADGGTFTVENPDGVEIGRVAVGATFDSDVKFVIADGATDFVAGDAFSITVGVEAGDKNFKALDLAAVDGAAVAAGVAVYGVTTDGTTKQKVAALVRGPAQVRDADLIWPDGITAVQKAAAINQLAAIGIIAR